MALREGIDYFPIVKGASPDNPITTIQYDSPESVSPNREDFDRERKRRMVENTYMTAPIPLEKKVADALDWIISMNNRIRFSAWMWIVIFGLFWFSMTLQMYWLPASLSEIYATGGYTFNVDGVTQLIDFYGVMVVIIFPAYVLIYGILSVYESIKRWRQAKRDMDLQAKFGG
jgi:hypothetical protein